MPITAIRTGDIFHTNDLNPGEEMRCPHIAFGINTVGTNQDGQSVAYQVGQRFVTNFQSIISECPLQIGDVYSMQGSLNQNTPAVFHGIVVNEKGSSGQQDWTFADLGMKTGLEELEKNRVVIPGHVEIRKSSIREEILGLIQDSSQYDFNKIAELVKKTELEINPPMRMAFIGTGPAGTKSKADWRGILQQMSDSDLNIVLYLWNREVQKEVAEVIRLFPLLRTSLPLRRIEEQVLAA